MARRKAITAAEYAYNILLQPEPEGGYTVTCPSLPGLVTHGETLEEARAMAADAIEGYRKCLEEDGSPLPESDPVAIPPMVDQIRVKLASMNDARTQDLVPPPRAACEGDRSSVVVQGSQIAP